MLPAIYASADVVALPSLFDAFPLVVLEAMACGRPVIVSENSGAADFVRDGVDGFVVPIRDATAIAERIEFLRERPELRERMGLAARSRASEYPWSSYGARVADIICASGAALMGAG